MESKVFEFIAKEQERQDRNIELIASENFVSENILKAVGSCFTNKYCEGYPYVRTTGRKGRYYGGTMYADELEEYCCDLWKKVYNTDYHVNVQPHSGSQANFAAYMSVIKPGDTILAMNLDNGGHLTHGSSVNFSGKLYNMQFYGVDENGFIDYEDMENKIKEFRPAIVLAGASAYSRIIKFDLIREIIDRCATEDYPAPYFVVDMAHIAGLIAAGVHPSPVPYADFVTTTTHKTLRGPRGGVIMCKEQYAKQIDKAVFPGTQGGPLMHIIAAKAVAFKEALSDEFKEYQKQILKNAQAMADQFKKNGIRLVSDGTDNHLMLLDLRETGVTGKDLEKMLDEVHITANKNTIPFETASPFITSGLRVGTPAVTSRGFKEQECRLIADLVTRVIREKEACFEEVKAQVKALCDKFPVYENDIR